MSKFKKSLLALGLGVTLCFLASVNFNVASASVSEKVVASYDHNLVLLSDIKPYLPKGSNVNNPTKAEIKKATEAYVVSKLKTSWEAKAKKEVTVSDSDVENILYSEAAKNGLTFTDFTRALAYQGININALRAKIKQSLLTQKMHAYLSENVKTQLDKESIELAGYKAYQKAKESNTLVKTPVKEISYIVLKSNPLVSEDQTKNKILSIKKKIDTNAESFADAAYKYSDDLISAANYGKFGLLTDLPPNQIEAFSREVNNLKVGQISKAFSVPGLGWVIAKVDGVEKVEAGVNYYINQEYQRVIKEKYSGNTLETFLLNSVIIHYN